MSYSYQMQVGKPGDNKTKQKSVADAPESRLAVTVLWRFLTRNPLRLARHVSHARQRHP
jgi:hypothetical protein